VLCYIFNMSSKILVANWKMNGSLDIFADYLKDLQKGYDFSNTQLIIAPPFPYLNFIKQKIVFESIVVAGQTAVLWNDGAKTGDINCRILKDVGCDFVILGHSECRINNTFNDGIASDTVKSALNNNLNIILCIGEEIVSERSDDVIIEQLMSGIGEIDKKYSKSIVIAYEPVWAIGTGITPTAEQILQKKQIIYAVLHSLGFIDTKIIYGGSVTPENAQYFITNAQIDGFIVGKACMKADSLKELLKYVDYATNL